VSLRSFVKTSKGGSGPDEPPSAPRHPAHFTDRFKISGYGFASVAFSGDHCIRATHGLPYSAWRKPCSVPIRVCEYEKLTMNYPADPDVPCERMMPPRAGAGELRRTFLQRWD
jgi:hypothetical protein